MKTFSEYKQFREGMEGKTIQAMNVPYASVIAWNNGHWKVERAMETDLDHFLIVKQCDQQGNVTSPKEQNVNPEEMVQIVIDGRKFW